MALLTSEQFEEHFETDLSDDAIDRLLNDAEADIIRKFGAHTSQIEFVDGLERLIFLQRRVTSISEIIETIAESDTTLSADDYQIENSRVLRRLSAGTNGRTRWGDRLKVTYVPESEADRRNRVQIDLVKLAIQHEGLTSSGVGNLRLDTKNYQERREEILSSLVDPLGFA